MDRPAWAGAGRVLQLRLLENLMGCSIHSADRIRPEWQDVGVGDEVKLHPEVALEVAVLEPGRSLILRGGVLPIGNTLPPYDFTAPGSAPPALHWPPRDI
jgi:hypothetical protein